MTDVVYRHTSGELEYPKHRITIDAAVREATVQIFEDTTTAYRLAVTKVVAETKQVTDDQTKRYLTPFVEEAIRRVGRHMLDQQDAAIGHVDRVAQEYRSRIHY